MRICAHDSGVMATLWVRQKMPLFFPCIYNPQITISPTSSFSASFNGNRVKIHPKPRTCPLMADLGPKITLETTTAVFKQADHVYHSDTVLGRFFTHYYAYRRTRRVVRSNLALKSKSFEETGKVLFRSATLSQTPNIAFKHLIKVEEECRKRVLGVCLCVWGWGVGVRGLVGGWKMKLRGSVGACVVCCKCVRACVCVCVCVCVM